MMKRIPYALTTLAAISITILPASIITDHYSKNLEVNYTYITSATTKKIPNITETNQRFCYYLTWAGTWLCF